jgi:carbonic anhydrase/acetyltransferase-like protein (isoleucine patch superfamily)
VLLIAPVAIHRLLFRRHQLQTLVSVAHRCALAGLALLGVAMVGMTSIIFAAVSGRNVGFAAGACEMALFTVCWLILPLSIRNRG